MCRVKLDPTTPGETPNPNGFMFASEDFEESLAALCKSQPTWSPVVHLRQCYIHELARRRLAVPRQFLVTPQDQWVKSFITARLDDPDPGDLPRKAEEALEIASEHPFTVAGMVAGLLKAGKGEVICEACKKSVPASELKVAKWGGGGPPLADSGGRKFKCPRGHVVLEVVDWIS